MNTGGYDGSPGDASDGAAFLDASAAAYRQAVQRLSEWTESATVYLRDRRPADVAADAVRLARERPAQTLATAAVLGLLVGTVIHSLTRR